MTVKDRVTEYCNRKNIAISRFEKLSGLSNGYFNQVKKRPSAEKIESINRAFPDLNTDWLLTGEGPMLSGDIRQSVTGQGNTAVAGNGNTVQSADLERALDEIAEQRKMTARAHEEIAEQRKITAKAQEQLDRLLSIMERMQG